MSSSIYLWHVLHLQKRTLEVEIFAARSMEKGYSSNFVDCRITGVGGFA